MMGRRSRVAPKPRHQAPKLLAIPSLDAFRAQVVAAKKSPGSQCGICNLPTAVRALVDTLLSEGGAASDCAAIARALGKRQIRDHKERVIQGQTIRRHFSNGHVQ